MFYGRRRRVSGVSPCKLRVLRVSVLEIAKKRMHHGGTENTEANHPVCQIAGENSPNDGEAQSNPRKSQAA
jgi:hypothetical protein